MKRFFNNKSSGCPGSSRNLKCPALSEFNYGSEEETEDEDEDILPQPFIPRAMRMFMQPDEDYYDAKGPIIKTEPDSEDAKALYQSQVNFEFAWAEFSNPPIPPETRRETFININEDTTLYKDPYETFIAIWDRSIMQYIADETNSYARQIINDEKFRGASKTGTLRIGLDWKDTDPNELYVFFAVVLATGVIEKQNIDEYWSSDEDIFTTPGFSAAMSCNRYKLLNRCLHFKDNTKIVAQNVTSAKLSKIEPIVNHLNKQFSKLYNLDENIFIDDSLTQWKGTMNIDQINNEVPEIITCDVYDAQTGYLWNFEVLEGKTVVPENTTTPISGTMPNLVLKLLRDLEHKGHTVWMNDCYTSPSLARTLKSLGFDCAGTVRTNRMFVPEELHSLKKSDMPVGTLYGCTSGDVDLLVWRDRSRVGLISTFHGISVYQNNETIQPALVHDYNQCMASLDKKDLMLAKYPIERKQTKVWYKKFFRRLLNVSVFNSFIIFKKNHVNESYSNFRFTLIRNMLQKPQTTKPNSSRIMPKGKQQRPQVTLITSTLQTTGAKFPAEVVAHFPEQNGFVGESFERLRRKCARCGKRTQTNCSVCGIGLCAFSCARLFHTLTH